MTRARKPFFQFVESRFQRLFFTRSLTWGSAPGWNDCAPLALKTNAARNSGSAEGATLINSLGQGPRALSAGTSPALKARFILGMCP